MMVCGGCRLQWLLMVLLLLLFHSLYSFRELSIICWLILLFFSCGSEKIPNAVRAPQERKKEENSKERKKEREKKAYNILNVYFMCTSNCGIECGHTYIQVHVQKRLIDSIARVSYIRT